MGLGWLLLHMCTSAFVQHYGKQGKASFPATESSYVLALAALGQGRAPLGWGLLAGQGQGSNELSPSSSAPSGQLSNCGRPLLKPGFMRQQASPTLSEVFTNLSEKML